jgi:DNA-binding transcriptional ArsR family regulator
MVESSQQRLDSVFHALSDATRRSLLREVKSGARAVGELAKPHPISLAAVSKHLQVLERAQLVRIERQGSHRMVHLNPQPLRRAQAWLAFYETFWQDRLDALQTHLEQAAVPAKKGRSHV